ncbi:hypothetical protein A3C59_01730 [Candidatus Daviesbacteria bacterium RIFCSPHIGHO2_02_FULL_36_13]|uniref:Uncharacterized protein n=1 Tax=Candidatus Daviesbacteria bacterium RIFCSPHIGHO2_02_FULL_36_13 TaxID=1797768 RepID=A0A1F5JWD2_9BACT|nr:MAG: hypothetical protein A3C59_01730 [Candidatus Daviesbacteria bacterium RIFCSPHIGHO2_02_FULL_36_13]
MNDADITKLAAKLTKSLATQDNIKEIKDDLKELATKTDLNMVKDNIKRLEKKIDYLDDKTNVILNFAENVNEDHEKRLKRIERVPVIAHQLKK